MYRKEDTNIAKTLGIVLMYIHHLFTGNSMKGYRISFAPFTENQMIQFATCCKVCVAIFVFLSTYGITLSFKKRVEKEHASIKNLYIDNLCRWIKVWSGFVVIYMLAQCFSFLGRSNTEVYGKGIRRIGCMVLDILGVAEIFRSPTFNPTWWYMGLLVAILLLLPLLYHATKKIGVVLLLLVIVIPRMLLIEFSAFRWYLPTMCMGILFAEYDIFARMSNLWSGKAWGRVVKCSISCAGLMVLFLFRYKTSLYLDVIDMLMAVCIIYMLFELFRKRSVRAKKVAGFIGKYSMNMFLAHTFFKSYYFKDFTYSFGNAWMILAMLIVTTLLFSIVVDKGKEYSGYNRMVERVTERLQKASV